MNIIEEAIIKGKGLKQARTKEQTGKQLVQALKGKK